MDKQKNIWKSYILSYELEPSNKLLSYGAILGGIKPQGICVTFAAHKVPYLIHQ